MGLNLWRMISARAASAQRLGIPAPCDNDPYSTGDNSLFTVDLGDCFVVNARSLETDYTAGNSVQDIAFPDQRRKFHLAMLRSHSIGL